MLITQTPETFKGGQIWNVIVNIHSALVGVGYGLLVLFFAMGIFQSAASFRDLQRPEFALRHFIRFAAAKVAVAYGMEIITAIFSICGGIVATVMSGMGTAVTQTATLPAEIVSAIEGVGFMESIPLWLVSFLGSLFITVMSFILILTVYGRFFKLYLYSALSPLPLSSFAGEGTSSIGKSFIKSYVGVVNPFSCFSDGIKFIVSLPILLLHWFGFISDETTRRAKHNWIIKLLNIIVTLVGFIGGLMSIVMGWNEFWQIICNIF